MDYLNCNRNRNRSRRFEISTEPTELKLREQDYSQALNQRKIDRQGSRVRVETAVEWSYSLWTDVRIHRRLGGL